MKRILSNRSTTRAATHLFQKNLPWLASHAAVRHNRTTPRMSARRRYKDEHREWLNNVAPVSISERALQDHFDQKQASPPSKGDFKFLSLVSHSKAWPEIQNLLASSRVHTTDELIDLLVKVRNLRVDAYEKHREQVMNELDLDHSSRQVAGYSDERGYHPLLSSTHLNPSVREGKRGPMYEALECHRTSQMIGDRDKLVLKRSTEADFYGLRYFLDFQCSDANRKHIFQNVIPQIIQHCHGNKSPESNKTARPIYLKQDSDFYTISTSLIKK